MQKIKSISEYFFLICKFFLFKLKIFYFKSNFYNKKISNNLSSKFNYKPSLHIINSLTSFNKKKINLKKTKFLKEELLKPTKIYVKEVLSLIKNNLINGCANITGGGLGNNIKRVIPDGLTANINLNKIKIKKIFSWLKKNNIEDKEMLKTFNCGVGFCLIIDPKNFDKVKKFFTKDYKPYVIGKIISGKNKIKLNEKINWS